MKFFKLITGMFLVVFFELNAQEKIFGRENEFLPNQKVYVFGDDVKLREASNTDAKVISLLKIASEVTVLEKTNESLLYNGIDSYWYKVKYKDTIGFMVGGLISLDKKEIDNSKYLVSLKKNKEDYYIMVRVVNEGNTYLENVSLLGVEQGFNMKVFDNQGVDSIRDMVYVDYMVESCGFDGGGYYLFNEGNTLKKAIEISQIGDGGNWFDEEVIFPTNKGGKEGKILYKKEIGEVLDEETEHTKTIIEKKELVWKGEPFVLTKDEN